MKCSMGVYVLVGLVWMMVVGCERFGTSLSEGTRNEYSKFIDGKIEQLRDSHGRLVVQFQQRGLESERQTVLNSTLNDLTRRREAVQRQIEIMKMAKGQDWFAIQLVMNHDLDEITKSYDQAFVQMPR